MSKITKVIVAVVLMATFSFSQEQKIEIRNGCRLANTFMRNIDGYALGFIASIPLAKSINFNSELNLVRRTLHIPFMISCGNYANSCFFIMEEELWELALSIPAQVQYVISLKEIAFFAETGIQLDKPLTKEKFRIEDADHNKGTKKRAAFDIGLPLGIGLFIGKHYGLGFRFTIGLTGIGEDIKTTLNQGEWNVIYML